MENKIEELIAQERKKPTKFTHVRVRFETHALLVKLQKELQLPFHKIIHIALQLLQNEKTEIERTQ